MVSLTEAAKAAAGLGQTTLSVVRKLPNHPKTPVNWASMISRQRLRTLHQITLPREAQERNSEALWRKLGDLLKLISPQACANFLKNSGYTLSKHSML